MRGIRDTAWSHMHFPALTRRPTARATQAADERHRGHSTPRFSRNLTIGAIHATSLHANQVVEALWTRPDEADLVALLQEWTQNPETLASWPVACVVSSLEALSRYSLAVQEVPEVFEVLLRELDRRLAKTGKQSLNPSLSSNPRAAILRILQAMATRALVYKNSSSHQSLSCSPKTLELLGENLVPVVSSLRPRQLRNLLHALATLGWCPTDSLLQEELLRACWYYYRALPPDNIAFLSSLITSPPHGLLTHVGPSPPSVLSRAQGLTLLLHPIRWALPKSSMSDLACFSRALQYTKGIWKRSSEAMSLLPKVSFILDEIAVRAARCVDGAKPEDVSQVISAFHRLEVEPNKHLLTVVESWADRRLSALTPHALTLALARFARMGTRSPRLLGTAASCVEGCLTRSLDNETSAINPEELAKIVWAFARLDFYPGDVVMSSAMRVLEQKAHTLPDIAASNLLWAVTRFFRDGACDGCSYSIDPNTVANTLLPVARLYSGQSAALVLWSLATITSSLKSSSIDEKTLFKVVKTFLGAVVNDMDSIDAHSISIATWAMGTLRFRKHSSFVEAVNLAIMQGHPDLSTYDSHHLSNLIWGIAKSGLSLNQTVLSVLSETCVPRLDEFSPSELFPLCWGFATMGYSDPSFIIACVTHFKARKDEFGGLELTGMLWSLAKLSDDTIWETKQDVIDACLRIASTQLARKSHLLQPSQVGMSVWAVGTLCSNYACPVINRDAFAAVSITSYRLVLDHLPALDPVSVSSVAEGLCHIEDHQKGQFAGNLMIEEIKGRVYHELRCKVTSPSFLGSMKPWEYGALAMHLASCLDGRYISAGSALDLGVKELLSYSRGEVLAAKAAPGSAVQLLVAMTICKCYPRGAYAAICKRLETLSPSYNLGKANLRLLCGAIERLKEQNMPVPRLSTVWLGRIRELQRL